MEEMHAQIGDERHPPSGGLLKARHILTLIFLFQGISFADFTYLRKESLKKNAQGE